MRRQQVRRMLAVVMLPVFAVSLGAALGRGATPEEVAFGVATFAVAAVVAGLVAGLVVPGRGRGGPC